MDRQNGSPLMLTLIKADTFRDPLIDQFLPPSRILNN